MTQSQTSGRASESIRNTTSATQGQVTNGMHPEVVERSRSSIHSCD